MNKKAQILDNSSGFTLVELAIVIVIIGLIVGGIVGGQSLIKSARIQSLVTDIKSYKTAYEAFRLEYSGIPGDFDEATDYWGTYSSGCPLANSPTGDGTCNGDGNKQIDTHNALYGEEGGLLWQHLGLAEIVNGSFMGRTGEVHSISTLEDDAPKGPLNNYYGFSYFSQSGIANDWGVNAAASSGNYIIIGGSSTDLNSNVLTHKQTMAIDKKIDDGQPRKGLFVSLMSSNCVSSNSVSATYNLNNKDKVCNPYYLID